MNGVKAHARRNSGDFELLFIPREKDILSNLELKKNEVFVDIGANVGFYTLRLAGLYPNNKIISIEAHPDTFKALEKNILEINHLTNVVLVNKAVFHSQDKIKFYQHDGYSGNSSIYWKLGKSITIDADTLDNIITSDFINEKLVMKMDIEGAEVDALKGANESLKNCRKILVEIHGDNLEKVKKILQNHGFEISSLITDGEQFVIGSKPGL
jgi:FkbM family methyltransferase